MALQYANIIALKQFVKSAEEARFVAIIKEDHNVKSVLAVLFVSITEEDQFVESVMIIIVNFARNYFLEKQIWKSIITLGDIFTITFIINDNHSLIVFIYLFFVKQIIFLILYTNNNLIKKMSLSEQILLLRKSLDETEREIKSLESLGMTFGHTDEQTPAQE